MNSKNKILSIGLIIILGAMMFLITGCAKSGSILKGLSTKDKCIELMAHATLAPSYGQNMAALETLQQKIDSLKQQYGWSDEDITANCAVFSQDNSFWDQTGKRAIEIKSEIK